MSGMASEMEARLAADGGAGLIQPDPATGAGGVPGNEGGAPPAAEPSTTENGAQGGQTPETIPYARFKEVNDKYSELKGYEQLKGFGYDPDSLGRLAAFEAQYQQDPYGTLKVMAERLELPQELIAQIVDPASGGANGANGPGPAQPGNPDQNGDQQLPAGVKERLDYVDQLREREAQASRDAQLNRIEAAWDKLDQADGLKETPRIVKLSMIRALADSDQQFSTVDDFAKAARSPLMEYRDTTLGSAVQSRQTGMTPSLPGSLPVPTERVDFGSDIKAASKAAQAAIERGEIPS